jgi:predicted small secreted protein
MKRHLLLFAVLLSFTQSIWAQENKEQTALNWLNENLTESKTNQGFEMLFSRPGPSGETFRYYHMVNGVEVFGSSYAIHVSNNNEVTYHSSTYDNSVETIDTTPNITAEDALSIAIDALNIEGNISQQDMKLYVYNQLDETKLVYRVTTNSEFLPGHWETIVDAKTSTVLSTRDIAIYENREVPARAINLRKESVEVPKVMESAPLLVDGTALVFDPDPLTKTTSLYGAPYIDNNDQTNPELDAARTMVTLFDLDFSGGLHHLDGPYVQIASIEAPNTGLFSQASPDFNFNRQEQGFEAATVYHHVDKTFRHINDDLGIPLVSIYNGGVVRYDPHGLNGADNSYYSQGSLVFGEGCVDDAEDMDVIIHELGHGLHDFVTNGNISQVNGLSEGTGDYFANSYKRSLGFWATSDASYYYVFGWDGHNPCWPGRTTNYGAQYPGGLTGQIHTDGQIWATVLLEIWEIIGRDLTDAAVLEGLAMTNGSTGQQAAAIAVRQAAIDMGYTCAQINTFTDRFEARGYVLPNYTCGGCSIAGISTSNVSACDDNGTPAIPGDDFFTADVTVTFSDPAATGTLDLSGDGTASVSTAGLTSPHTFTAVQMSADGGSIDLTATFSDDTACTLNVPNAGTAPDSCSLVGISEFEDALGISVYPNPAESEIMLLNVTQKHTVAIYNILGQKVIEQEVDVDATSINISNLSNGTYLMKFEGYSEVLKIVKK